MNLEINNISKNYTGNVRALENINLTTGFGIMGLLGPNGAGKSTLLRTIATLQEPDSGQILFNGIDIYANKQYLRKSLGYLPQDFGVYPRISAKELLNHLAILKGIQGKKDRLELVDKLLHETNLYQHKNKYISTYSGGMKQRFGIAQALIGNPKLLIVDEPTAGLDPEERNRFYNILSEIGEKTIVILSTHIVEDVNELCSEVAIISKGILRYKGQTQDAILRVKECIWEKEIIKSEIANYAQNHNIISTKLIQGKPIIRVNSEKNPDHGFTQKSPNLEDAYFSLIA